MDTPLNKKKLIVTIDGREYDQTHVPAYRVFKASEMWNAFMVEHGDGKGGILANETDITNMTLDVGIYLLKRNFSDIKHKKATFSHWFHASFLNKKKILRSMDIKELNEFLDVSLEPVLGSKKKGLMAQKRLYDLTADLLQGMPEAELRELLQNLPAVLDGVRKKSSISA
jgi:hypothetical protein